MARAKRRSSASRWIDEAKLQALVRFGPEQSGLAELMRQAEENRAASIAQAHGSAAALSNAIDQARPQVAAIYDRAGLAQAATAGVLGRQVASLPDVADPIRAAMLTEQAQGSRHLREEGAQSLANLATQRVQARQGEQFAVQSAQRQFAQDAAKVLARKQSLAGEKGAFTASTAMNLEEAYLGRLLSARNSARSARTETANSVRSATQSERNSLRSAGIDPDTGQPIPNGPLDPKVQAAKKKAAGKATSATGAPLNTADAHRAARSDLSKAVQSLKTLDPDVDLRNWGPLGDLLQQGQKSQTLKDPKTGKDRLTGSGTPLTTPEVPSVPHEIARAALDLYYHGGLSRDTKRMLADAGYSIRQLGLAGRRIKSRRPSDRGRASSGRRAATHIPGLGSIPG